LTNWYIFTVARRGDSELLKEAGLVGRDPRAEAARHTFLMEGDGISYYMTRPTEEVEVEGVVASGQVAC
jgi:hypothetical protein